MASTTPQGRIPGLDGWRAVAIALVLLSHGTFNANLASQFWVDFFNSLPRGEDGVRIFFCLSGFLITHLLLREECKNGGISLKSFYARRALRILPVYFAYVATVALLNIALHWEMIWKSFVPPLTFTTGLWWRRYEVWEFAHFWTLSVEEVFYLLWPFFLIIVPKKYRIGIVVIVLALLPTARVAADGTAFEFYLTGITLMTTVDYLLMGCLFALFYGFLTRLCSALPSWTLTTAKCLALLLFLLVWLPIRHGGSLGISRDFIRTASLGPGTTSMALAITVLIVATALSPKSLLTRLLEFRVVAGFGLISYGVYVWHQLFINPFADEPAIWQKFPLNICIAVGVGWLSYALYEKKFLKYKVRFVPAKQGEHSQPAT